MLFERLAGRVAIDAKVYESLHKGTQKRVSSSRKANLSYKKLGMRALMKVQEDTNGSAHNLRIINANNE